VRKFTDSIVDISKAITTPNTAVSKLGLTHPKDGLVIFIDEADNASEHLDLGTLVKELSEKSIIEASHNILLVLGGLPVVRTVLLDSHKSALRLFEELELAPLSGRDVRSVIRQGLEEANKKQTDHVTVTEEALDLIVGFSEGYPHFVQQFGYTSYAVDEDNIIDKSDVSIAAFDKGGAFDLIGDKYYKDMYFNKIKKDAYRHVLRIMSTSWNNWISKDYIRERFRGKVSTLDNAIKALADKNIILRNPNRRGEYRLQWAGFAIWINYFTKGSLSTIQNVENHNEDFKCCFEKALEYYTSSKAKS